jgi:hypothetical protein
VTKNSPEQNIAKRLDILPDLRGIGPAINMPARNAPKVHT